MKTLMGATICLNALQVVYESDVGSACRWEGSQSDCDLENGWLLAMNWIYLTLYSCEVGIRVYVYRTQMLLHSWDMFDASIIVAGIIGEILDSVLPSTGILRLFRLVRLFRAIHFVKLPKELHIMIHGFMSALVAIAVGAVLVFVMLTLWSVVAVALFNQANHAPELLQEYERLECDWGPKAWSSVSNSIFTFTQLLIMGENWDCNAIPLIERNPWALALFVAVFFTVVLGMTNLILAVIVDKALQDHEDDLEKAAKDRKRNQARAITTFTELCTAMDEDGSGSLTLDELQQGFANSKQLQDTLAMMDVGEKDLDILFGMMDSDQSGDVSYDEFGAELAKIKNQSMQTMLAVTKHHVLLTQTIVADMYKIISGGKPFMPAGNAELDLGASDAPNVPVVEEMRILPKIDVAKEMPPSLISTTDMEQLRTSIQEACSLLKMQCLALAESPSGAAFVAARAGQASSADGRPPLEPKMVADQEAAMCKPFVEELKGLEERITQKLSSIRDDLKPQGLAYMCIPNSSRIDSRSGSATGDTTVRRV